MSVSSHIKNNKKNNKKCPTPLNCVRSCQILPKTNGQTYVRNRWVTTCLTIVLCILNSLEIQNPWVPGVYLFFSENDGLWRQTPETPKTPCFGKAIGCPGCFLMSEGWVARGNYPQKSCKFLQNSRKSQNDGELTFSDSQGLGMAPLGNVPLSNDMKCLKLLKSLESGNPWFFPKEWISRRNLSCQTICRNMSTYVSMNPVPISKNCQKPQKICHEKWNMLNLHITMRPTIYLSNNASKIYINISPKLCPVAMSQYMFNSVSLACCNLLCKSARRWSCWFCGLAAYSGWVPLT